MNIEDLQNYDFNYLIQDALSKVPETVDKRQGSIIYDALAPACYELADYYMQLYNLYLEINIDTAVGVNLEHLCANLGIQRLQATYAVKLGYFTNTNDEPMEIPLNSRFSTIGENPINYYVEDYHYDEGGEIVSGTYNLRCEQLGRDGNSYTGSLLPISFINNLKTATMTDVVISARDEETDDELRQRYKDSLTEKEFAGNIFAYKSFLKSIEGIGYAQVYSIWNGPGTVKCVLTDFDFEPINVETVQRVKNIVDPEDYEGFGVGIAPIGHTVTISAPTKKTLDISTKLTLAVGYQLEQLKTLIQEEINSYLDTVRSRWDQQNEENEYSLTVYIAQINRAILSVPGVDNVTNTKINNTAEDLVLTENSTLQEIPFLGEITYE